MVFLETFGLCFDLQCNSDLWSENRKGHLFSAMFSDSKINLMHISVHFIPKLDTSIGHTVHDI